MSYDLGGDTHVPKDRALFSSARFMRRRFNPIDGLLENEFARNLVDKAVQKAVQKKTTYEFKTFFARSVMGFHHLVTG